MGHSRTGGRAGGWEGGIIVVLAQERDANRHTHHYGGDKGGGQGGWALNKISMVYLLPTTYFDNHLFFCLKKKQERFCRKKSTPPTMYSCSTLNLISCGDVLVQQ